MPSFDLLTEPWIPVLDAGTGLRTAPDARVALREVGLREALLRAHEIREVYTDSPLETIALNRLLLALALDVYQREPDVEGWVALWKAGCFPAEPLDAYLDVWGDRFDLLHPEHPFFQASQPKARDASVVSNLFHHFASGNNATLFSHALDSSPPLLPLSTLARGVVTAQAFGFSGLAGAATAGGRLPNFSQGPLVGRAQFWIRGRSLFEALLLNGPPDESARMGATSADVPVWRSNPSGTAQSRRHRGLLDVLTWTSRHITLVTKEAGADVTVEGVYLSPADKLEPQPTDDPLAAHVKSKDKGLFPLGFRTDRALWRDASVLFSVTRPGAAGAPATFRWVSGLARLLQAEFSELKRVFREQGVDAFGLVNDQAKAELWRHERLPLHVAILQDEALQAVVGRALEHAEKQITDPKKGLRRAIRVTAEYALAPPAPGDDAYPNADPKAVTALAQSLGAEPRYWAALEPPFFAFLGRLAETADASARTVALVTWQQEVYQAARSAFDAATASFDGDARHLRATAEGRARLQPVARPADGGEASPPPPPEPDPTPPLPLFA